MVKFGWDKLKRFLAQANSWTGQQTFSNIAVTGGTISGATITENFTSATDPLANAAVSTTIVNAYNGTVVTLTGAGNSQTLQNPTTAATIRKFMVINNDTSNNNLSVVANSVTFVLTPGEGQCFLWDGSAWGPTDLGITSIPVPVTQGGTGASTLTDHGVLLGSGTDPITALGIMTNGQLVIGSTGNDPVVASITDGEGIDTTAGAGTLTIACEDATASNKGVAVLPVLTNLLTNSQWMAASGSTLCEATSGAAPVTDGANAALVNNLLTNGGFDSATTGWNAGANAALTSDAGGKTGNCLTVTENGLENPCAYQTVTTVVGKLYTLNLYINAGTEATYLVRIGTSGVASQENDAIDGEAADNWTDTVITKTFEATGTSTTITLYQICSTLAATTLMFDSVTLYEVTPGYVAADTLAPDGGTKTATLDIHRAEADSTHCKGYYGLKYTKGADTAEYHNILSITNRGQLDKLKGQTVTFGMAGYSVTATDNLKIQIYDSVTAVTSSAFWGADALGWKEISQAVASNATELTFQVLLDGDTADVAYGSFYMALNGSSIGEYNYAPKPSEQILCDANIALTGYTATTSAADGIINLEAASSGMIGKGVKAVLVKAYGKDSAAGDGVGFDVQSASGVEDGLSIDTQVNNVRVQGANWVKCDSNGDIYFDHRGSGASALTADIKVIGIEP